MWIDPVDKQVMRLEARPTRVSDRRRAAGLGAARLDIRVRATRLADGVGCRVLRRSTLRPKFFLFADFRLDATREYSDYKRFTTRAGEAHVDAPKSGPTSARANRQRMDDKSYERGRDLGGGLAAGSGVAGGGSRAHVRLYEMRPVRHTPAHRTDRLAEIVCSNSLKSDEPGTAPYLLKEELRRAGFAHLEAAAVARVPAARPSLLTVIASPNSPARTRSTRASPSCAKS